MKILKRYGIEYVPLSSFPGFPESPIMPGYTLYHPGMLEQAPSQPASYLIRAVDFSVICFHTLAKVERSNSKVPKTALYELAWEAYFTTLHIEVQRWIDKTVGDCDFVPIKSVILTDVQDKLKYWRNRIYPPYKMSRGSKPKQFHLCKRVGLRVAQRLGFPILGKSGFEADDWAGYLVRNIDNLSGCKGVILETVDTDWLQLVNDSKNIVWFNEPYPPLIRDESVTREYWLRRHKRAIDHPRQIVDDKLRYGDQSDDIAPETGLRGIIDLLEPTVLLKPPIEALRDALTLSKSPTVAGMAQRKKELFTELAVTGIL